MLLTGRFSERMKQKMPRAKLNLEAPVLLQEGRGDAAGPNASVTGSGVAI